MCGRLYGICGLADFSRGGHLFRAGMFVVNVSDAYEAGCVVQSSRRMKAIALSGSYG